MFKLNTKQKIYFSIIVTLCFTNMILGLVNLYSIPLIYFIAFNGIASIILTTVLANSIIDSNLVKVNVGENKKEDKLNH